MANLSRLTSSRGQSLARHSAARISTIQGRTVAAISGLSSIYDHAVTTAINAISEAEQLQLQGGGSPQDTAFVTATQRYLMQLSYITEDTSNELRYLFQEELRLW